MFTESPLPEMILQITMATRTHFLSDDYLLDKKGFATLSMFMGVHKEGVGDINCMFTSQ